MTGDSLRAHLREALSVDAIRALVDEYCVQEGERKLKVFELVVALILAGGTPEGGRQYDILRTHIENGAERARRATFDGWFTAPLLDLLTELLDRAIDIGRRQPKLLPGILGGVSDWRVVDSTTIRLDDALVGDFPSTGDHAALKVHKEWSVGTGNLVAYKITPAREHDGPHLDVGRNRRGTGLLMDLEHAGIARLAGCEVHDVKYVIRLKESWKPKVDRLVRGSGFPGLAEEADFDILSDEEVIVLDGQAIDADVTVGNNALRVRSRLVGIPTPEGCCFFLTNVPRKTHGPHQVGDLYRVRREIELDNHVEDAGTRLDEITARKPMSAKVLVLAALLNATIARTIVQSEKLAAVTEKKKSVEEPAARAPLHAILLMRALSSAHGTITRLLWSTDGQPLAWGEVMLRLRDLGSDPNWRRPGVLDRIQGLTAPAKPRRRPSRGAGRSTPARVPH